MQERSCRGTSSPAGPQALVIELRTRPPAPAAGAGQPGREFHEVSSSHLPPFPFLINARVLPESFGEVLVHRLPRSSARIDPSAPERLVISHDRQVRHMFNVALDPCSTDRVDPEETAPLEGGNVVLELPRTGRSPHSTAQLTS